MIGEGHFGFARKEDRVVQEAALGGIYIIHTNALEEQLPAREVVAAYERLSRVDETFRSLKSVDLEIRPIHHRLEERIRAHAFLCLLAEYLVFHRRAAWGPLTFADTERNQRRTDAVAKAERGAAA